QTVFAAPGAAAVEFVRRRLIGVPASLYGIELVSAVEESDEAGRVVRETDFVARAVDVERRLDPRHIEARCIGIVSRIQRGWRLGVTGNRQQGEGAHENRNESPH